MVSNKLLELGVSYFLVESNFKIGNVDTTLFNRDHLNGFILNLYVDDIIFGVINDLLCKEFSVLV